MCSTNIDGSGARLAVPVTTEGTQTSSPSCPLYFPSADFLPKVPFLSRRLYSPPGRPRVAQKRPHSLPGAIAPSPSPYALLASFWERARREPPRKNGSGAGDSGARASLKIGNTWRPGVLWSVTPGDSRKLRLLRPYSKLARINLTRSMRALEVREPIASWYNYL